MLKEDVKEHLAAVQEKKPGPLSSLHNGYNTNLAENFSAENNLSPQGVSLEKINNWAAKKTNTAWPKIKKEYIVTGLKAVLLDYYGKTIRYSKTETTSIRQGHYPCCGPTALMFYLAKKDINNFIDRIIYLYETGKVQGWKKGKKQEWLVTKKLREYDAVPEDFYKSKDNPKPVITDADLLAICRLSWMFNASMAEKENNLTCITPKNNTHRMYYTVTEMIREIQFLFNVSEKSIIRSHTYNWQKNDDYLKNVDEWISTLKKNGTVFWLMHGDAISNEFDNQRYIYTRLGLEDLHWVVVLKVEKLPGKVKVLFHSWGQIYEWEIDNAQLRKMTRDSLAFVAP